MFNMKCCFVTPQICSPNVNTTIMALSRKTEYKSPNLHYMIQQFFMQQYINPITNKYPQGVYKFPRLEPSYTKQLFKPTHIQSLAYTQSHSKMRVSYSQHTFLRLQLGGITTFFPAQKSRRVSIKPSRKSLTKYIHFIQVSRDEMHMPCYAIF